MPTAVRRRYALLPEGDWDFDASLGRQLASRFIGWMNARPWRRRIGWPLLGTQLLVVLSAFFAPDAAAATTTTAISWTGVADSHGVPAADYMFSTDHGSVMRPFNSQMSGMLGLEFALFLVVTVSAVWFIAYAMSFNWLNFLSKPVQEINVSLGHSLLVPGLLMACAGIGAGVVGFHFLRGNVSKGSVHIASILLLMVLGTTVFAHPLEQVLSSHGPLATGRDVGVSVAAAVTGNSDADPHSIVQQLQGNMVDNFIRHPLQLWNFGENIDAQSPMCSDAWSNAIKSGNEDSVKNAMHDCGSPSSVRMKAAADRPSAGQIGTGIVLILFSLLLLAFGAYFAGKIIERAFHAIGMAILALPALAATSIPGAPQVLYLRCIADALMAAVSMSGYITLLGIYSLALKTAFDATRDNGIAVVFLGGIMMVIGLVMIRRLSASLEAGSRKLTAGMGRATGNNGSDPVAGNGPGHRSHHMRGLTNAAVWAVSPQGRVAMSALRGRTHALPPVKRTATAQQDSVGWPGVSAAAVKKFPDATQFTGSHIPGRIDRVVEIPASHPNHPAHPDHAAHLERQAAASSQLAATARKQRKPAATASNSAPPVSMDKPAAAVHRDTAAKSLDVDPAPPPTRDVASGALAQTRTSQRPVGISAETIDGVDVSKRPRMSAPLSRQGSAMSLELEPALARTGSDSDRRAPDPTPFTVPQPPATDPSPVQLPPPGLRSTTSE